MNALMKWAGLLPAALFLIFSAPVSALPADEVGQIDRIVAVVDKDVITYGELRDRIQIVFGQLEKQGTQRPPQDVLEKTAAKYREALDRLVA